MQNSRPPLFSEMISSATLSGRRAAWTNSYSSFEIAPDTMKCKWKALWTFDIITLHFPLERGAGKNVFRSEIEDRQRQTKWDPFFPARDILVTTHPSQSTPSSHHILGHLIINDCLNLFTFPEQPESAGRFVHVHNLEACGPRAADPGSGYLCF